MLGAQAVAKAFPDYSTSIVKVHPPAVHLKDYISMAGPEVMAIGSSAGAQKTFQVIDFVHLLKHFVLYLNCYEMHIIIILYCHDYILSIEFENKFLDSCFACNIMQFN